MNEVTQLSHLLVQVGPFGFSVVFLLILSRWGYKIWNETVTRKKPPSQAEKVVNGGVFVCLVLTGLILTAVSVSWWWNHRPFYWYESQISSLSETELLEGDSLFVRNNYLQAAAGAPQYRDAHLLIFQQKPFADGQVVNLTYTKDNVAKHTIEIVVKLNEKTRYGMEFASSAWKLKRLGVGTALLNSTALRMPDVPDMIPSAHAQGYGGTERPALRGSAPGFEMGQRVILPVPPQPMVIQLSDKVRNVYSPSDLKNRPTTLISRLESALEILQSPFDQVSAKVVALDRIGGASISERGDLFNMDIVNPSSLTEPAFLTVADLARHTDQEIAAKARKILVNSPLPSLHFAELLTSRNTARRSLAVKEFLRLEPQYADLVLKDLTGLKVDASMLAQVATTGNQWRLLVPTGTSSGDRYFVKASWDAKDQAVTSCLSDAFGKSLSVAVRGTTEIDAREQRASRLLADGEKEKILTLAAQVQKCGGEASFVGFYASAK